MPVVDRRRSQTILVVDEEDASRSATAAVLTKAGYTTRRAASGEEALEIVRGSQPQAVLLEVCLRDISGYELCHELRSEFGWDLPIIFLSGRRKESFDRVAGLLIGADDYLVKPFAPDELIARIRRFFDRGDRVAPRARFKLTPREMEVLRLLAEGRHQAGIASRLLISEKTVASHMQHIFVKLEVHSRVEAVAFAYREKLVGHAERRSR